MDGQNNQGNYQVPPVVTSGEQKSTDPMAIVSLILGILSILLGCCTAYWGLIPGIVGLVLAILSNKKAKSGLATAGMVCSIIGIVIALIITVIGLLGLSMLDELGYSY